VNLSVPESTGNSLTSWGPSEERLWAMKVITKLLDTFS
jgi:hypothetical protein